MKRHHIDGGLHQKFYVAKVKNAHGESDNDDEEDYCLKRDEMGNPIYGPNCVQYLSCDDPVYCVLALQESLNPFRKIYVWKKAVSFLGSLPVPLQHAEWIPNYSKNFGRKGDGDGKWHAKIRITVGTHDDEADSSRPKRTRQHETVEEAMLPRVHHDFFLWGTSNRADKIRYNTNLARLFPKQIYSPCIIDWNVLNTLGCGEKIKVMLEIKVHEMGGQEEIFTSEA
ncbi:hypothetical protein Tco_1004371 [Tanacetum coccineum]|uniref:Uncharacterized protein n=1 Tax=Tanacetum coccineum TaxID=301880 RepID=A0ABQ5FCG1_9ASTR